MTRGGPVRAELAAGVPQSRVCVCDSPAVFSDTENRCVKCGYQAGPDRTPLSMVFPPRLLAPRKETT